MTTRIKIPGNAFKYILFQRTAYITYTEKLSYKLADKVLPGARYNATVEREAQERQEEISEAFNRDMGAEYEDVKSSLPENCRSVLDIGCGVAGIDIFLFEHFGSSEEIDFYLLDKSSIEEKVFYKFEEKGAFYNSLAVAKDLLEKNGIRPDKIHTMEVTPDNRININNKVDLVISLISWGFHYPVATYIERVHKILNDKGRLIMDIRKGQGGEEVIAKYFPDFKVISESRKSVRIVAER